MFSSIHSGLAVVGVWFAGKIYRRVFPHLSCLSAMCKVHSHSLLWRTWGWVASDESQLWATTQHSHERRKKEAYDGVSEELRKTFAWTSYSFPLISDVQLVALPAHCSHILLLRGWENRLERRQMFLEEIGFFLILFIIFRWLLLLCVCVASCSLSLALAHSHFKSINF